MLAHLNNDTTANTKFSRPGQEDIPYILPPLKPEVAPTPMNMKFHGRLPTRDEITSTIKPPTRLPPLQTNGLSSIGGHQPTSRNMNIMDYITKEEISKEVKLKYITA